MLKTPTSCYSCSKGDGELPQQCLWKLPKNGWCWARHGQGEQSFTGASGLHMGCFRAGGELGGWPSTCLSIRVLDTWHKGEGIGSSMIRRKEAYPMLPFEVVVSQMRKNVSVSPVFFGADNDKTTAHFDPAIEALQYDRLLSEDWKWIDSDGHIQSEKGMYSTCDGGYFIWKCLMCLVQHRPEGS